MGQLPKSFPSCIDSFLQPFTFYLKRSPKKASRLTDNDKPLKPKVLQICSRFTRIHVLPCMNVTTCKQFRSIPSLLLFPPFMEYSIVKSLSLSFPLTSFCFTSHEVPCFPACLLPVCEQMIEFIFPVSTHHFILLNSVQFSTSGQHQLYFCPTGGQVLKAL